MSMVFQCVVRPHDEAEPAECGRGTVPQMTAVPGARSIPRIE